MRVRFSEVFNSNPDGSFSPRSAVRIGGVTMGTGVSFRRGVSFSGIDIATYAGRDLEVEQAADGVIKIEGTY